MQNIGLNLQNVLNSNWKTLVRHRHGAFLERIVHESALKIGFSEEISKIATLARRRFFAAAFFNTVF